MKTSSIKLVGTMLQARVKENYLSPRESTKKGKTYQSVRTDYRIDCTPRKVAMVESKFYAGTDLQGEEIQKASRNDRNLIWMDAPRATVFGEILDYTCKHAPTAGRRPSGLGQAAWRAAASWRQPTGETTNHGIDTDKEIRKC